MESWIIWGSQMAITLMIGAIGYFLKRSMDKMEAGINGLGKRIEQVDAKHKEDLDEVKKEMAALKADLPLVYVLREDFLRVMNNVDAKLDKLLYRTGGSNKNE